MAKAIGGLDAFKKQNKGSTQVDIKKRLTDLNARVNTLQLKKTSLNAKLQVSKQEVNTATQNHEEAQKELDELERKHALAKTENQATLDKAEQQLSDVTTQHANATTEHAAIKKSHDDSSKILKDASTSLKNIKEQHKKTIDEHTRSLPTFDEISNKAIGLSLTGFSLIGCILAFMGWCIYQIIQKIQEWFNKSRKRAAAASASASQSSQNAVNNRANDNEVYNNSADISQPLDDEHAAITKSIQDSFKKHQIYNDKLTAYYNNVKGKEGVPDGVIDAKVLLPQYD